MGYTAHFVRQNRLKPTLYNPIPLYEMLGRLLSGNKSMIIRGAAGRKVPYGQVKEWDRLYFINNNAEGKIIAKA